MSNPQFELLVPRADARVNACRGPRTCDMPGLGWSESSWDLARGLTVVEGLPADASVNEWLVAALAD